MSRNVVQDCTPKDRTGILRYLIDGVDIVDIVDDIRQGDKIIDSNSIKKQVLNQVIYRTKQFTDFSKDGYYFLTEASKSKTKNALGRHSKP
jgi:hypothetical protein